MDINPTLSYASVIRVSQAVSLFFDLSGRASTLSFVIHVWGFFQGSRSRYRAYRVVRCLLTTLITPSPQLGTLAIMSVQPMRVSAMPLIQQQNSPDVLHPHPSPHPKFFSGKTLIERRDAGSNCQNLSVNDLKQRASHKNSGTEYKLTIV